MADWHLAPALEDLRGELNELSPNRDKRSDGTIGDAAHQATSSKHNPNSQGVVRAFDCDKTGPWPTGVTFTDICNFLAERHREGRDNRLQNIIWNRRIASRSWGWTWRTYTGANAHTEHAHFEVRDSATYWNKRGPWGLVKEFGMLDTTDLGKIEAIVKRYVGDVVPRYDADGKKITTGNTTMTVASSLEYVGRDMALLKQSLGTALRLLAQHEHIDTAELVAALAPALAATVVAMLPEDRDDVTPAELQDAIVGALKVLVDRPPA